MRKFDILSRELKTRGTHFLEASAGTGKTFTIEHWVTRLLIEGDAPLTIDQILVVTFTRAATRELKLRIHQNLRRCKDLLLEKQEAYDYLEAMKAQGEEAVEGALLRIEQALLCFDEAQIFTVHGFCHRALAESAFEAGIVFDPPSPEQGGHQKVVSEKIRDVLRSQIKLPLFSSSQIRRVMKRHRGKVDKWIHSVSRTISRRQQIAPFPSFASLLHTWQEALTRLRPIELGLWLEDFLLLKSCYLDMRAPLHEEVALAIGKMLVEKRCSEEAFDHLLSQETWFLEKMVPAKLMKKAKLPSASELHYPGLIEELQETLLPLLKEGTHSNKIQLRMARLCQEACQTEIAAREQFSPDDLLEKMRDALESPSFLSAVRSQYRAAVIDEFQDTDPLQWAIFHKLFLAEGARIEALCLVGDPKQSIYAFRNADVYTYLAAAEALGEESRAYLDTNYRSSFSLVKALNCLFASSLEKGWMRLPARGVTLAVPEVNAADHSAVGGVHFLIATAKATHLTKKWPTDAIQEEGLFPFIAIEMQRLRSCEQKPWDHFAILVKDRYQARQLHAFFSAHNIPSCIKRGGSLADTDAYHALLELLQAALAPHDLSALKRLLLGPLVAWDVLSIAETLDNDKLWQAKATLLELAELFSQNGFACFFQEFLSRFRVSEQILSRGSVSLYRDLRQLAEILIEHETLSHPTREGLLHYFESLSRLDPEEEGWLKVRSSEEKGSVLLLTTHLSKGLEFDTVFALGMASRHTPGEEMVVQEKGARTLSVCDLSQHSCQQALEETDAEKLRQLYVALTRAKTRVYLPIVINEGYRDSLKPGGASPAELFCSHLCSVEPNALSLSLLIEKLEQLSQQASIRYTQIEPPLTVPVETTDLSSTAPLLPPLMWTPPERKELFFSFSSLAQKRALSQSVPPPELSLLPNAHQLPLGAETGILFHQIIEKVLQAGWHAPFDAEAVRSFIASLTRHSPFEKWKEVLEERIQSVVRLPLLSFCLADVPAAQMMQEAPFVYPVAEGMMKGFADLFFEYQEKYYLLDWKTNYLGPTDRDYNKENLERAMQENDYTLQASLYAEALRRYVKLFDNRPFEQCFGGALYLFVRGNAVIHFIPELPCNTRK